MTLVERIAKLCSEQGTTMTAIERENGLAVSSIRKWDDHAPTIPKLVIVAKALNTTVSYLIGETEIKNPVSETETGKVPTIQNWKDFLATFNKEELKAIIDMATSELIGRD